MQRQLLLLCVVALLCVCSGEEGTEEVLVGWRGETYKPKDGFIEGEAEQVAEADTILDLVSDHKKAWIQTLSWKPRAFVYHNFLSQAEVRHVLQLAAPQMKRSTVVGPNNTGVVDNIRTSAGTFLMRNQDAIITKIEERLAVWSHLPPSHQEDMQVLRYGPTNKYGAHLDGLGRVMSVLIYLIAPEEGGETAFPSSNGWLHPEMGEASQGPFSACAKNHVAYKPKQGDALMFYDMRPNYRDQDIFSEHTGCPVIKGVKWNAVKWIHGKPFHPDDWEQSLTKKYSPLPDPGVCADLHEQCAEWAEQGECTKNPGYMTGHEDGRGMCRKACNDCIICASDDDEECMQKNRAKGGYMNLDRAEFKGLLD